MLGNSSLHGLGQQHVIQGHNQQIGFLQQTHNSCPLDVVVEALTSVSVTHLDFTAKIVELTGKLVDVQNVDFKLVN